MSEDGRDQPFRVRARQSEFVGVTDTRGLDLHENLGLLRVSKVHVLYDKRLACSNSGAGAPGDAPL